MKHRVKCEKVVAVETPYYGYGRAHVLDVRMNPPRWLRWLLPSYRLQMVGGADRWFYVSDGLPVPLYLCKELNRMVEFHYLVLAMMGKNDKP